MIAQDGQWRRTAGRMVLIIVVGRIASLALPVVFIATRQDGWWSLVAAAVGAVLAVVSAVLSWLVTLYRFDAERLQVRRGLVARTTLTAPLDRVRTVDLEAPLLHRALGLAKVTIGTGTSTDRITLDSLDKTHSAVLRDQLLAARHLATGVEPVGSGPSAATDPTGASDLPAVTHDVPAHDGFHHDGTGPATQAPAAPGPPTPAPEPTVLARLSLGWVRFAPASMVSGAVVLLMILGAVWFATRTTAITTRLVGALPGVAWVAVLVMASLLLVGGMLMSTLTWVTTWWGATLTREPGGTLHLRRGLTTTTSTTVEEARIRGVRLVEPLLVRWLRGANLQAWATGVGAGGTVNLLPTAPREVATAVGRSVLEPPPGPDPLTVRTRRHGRVAHRRLFIGAVIDTAVLLGLAWLVAAWRGWEPPWALLAAGLLAWSGTVAQLEHLWRGYALVGEHLVVTTGALRHRRVVLQTRGVLGWAISQSVLQRRVGLATLTATTAAGPGFVRIRDVTLADAQALAVAATPDMWAASESAPATGAGTVAQGAHPA
ncbi:PH domain-containing protein [Cellulomonas bogoriensis]|uniref:YdbS-like PH domain-containing protein n=1 Tax=Cellulomonas bogoriensis 69B4 = DSM 16987 TaxID=1386082 RepID=A0A0A0C1X8_9CELL|nr:PH domain-containing protein [Cellulomonas bogoriensis]KGM13389.1 hypothetical protein N869_14425 [Cellulomonas bogoriensis 69B4 = DSM 16987]